MNAGISGLVQIKARMKWLAARSAVLSDNVANADTPRFAPRDLARPSEMARSPGLAVSHAAHIAIGLDGRAGTVAAAPFETRPSGNSVSLEDEMLKLTETQLEHQMLTGLYQRSLGYLKTAIGRRG